MSTFRVPRPFTAETVYESLKSAHRKIVLRLQAEGKTKDWTPAWYVHLPSGERVRIRWFGVEGVLLRFTTPDDLPILLAPEALALTIEPLSEDVEGFPVEFLDESDEDAEEDEESAA
jgi:hypothetical protein